MNTLPSEYQRVEYIQSSGNCRIDTGVHTNGSYFKIATKINFVSFSSSATFPYVFGPVDGGQCFICYDNNGHIQYGAGNNDILKYSIATNTDYSITAEWNSGTLITNLNGNSATDIYSGGLSTHDIPIFCRRRSNNVGYDSYSTNLKIYYFQMYSGESTLARNLIPCYRKSDGVIGMYDLVGGTFYTNAGSGTFTKGPDVKGFKVKKVYIGTKLVRPKPKTEDVVLLSSGGAINKYSESTYNYYSNCIRNQNTYWDAYIESTDQSGIRYFQFTDEIVGFKISMAATNQNNYGAIECMLSPDGNISSVSRKRFVNGIRTITTSKDYQGSNTGKTSVGTVANEVGIDSSNISKSSATATATIQGILENNKRKITMSNSSGETGSHEFDYSTPLYYIGRMPYGRSTGVMGYVYTAEVTLKK